jgi:hypothetical protein
MLGQQVSFNFIKPSNTIPHYFDELEIIKIFNVCYNIKHLAMLKTMFYASLHASELCNRDDSDIDLKALTIFCALRQRWQRCLGLYYGRLRKDAQANVNWS